MTGRIRVGRIRVGMTIIANKDYRYIEVEVNYDGPYEVYTDIWQLRYYPKTKEFGLYDDGGRKEDIDDFDYHMGDKMCLGKAQELLKNSRGVKYETNKKTSD